MVSCNAIENHMPILDCIFNSVTMNNRPYNEYDIKFYKEDDINISFY